ncbi:MAG TPA: redoxin domain-containing protein [Syntrophorhabdaceae bacterium]|nr:redoxin domain-containing protein [Syntrophorhabdaceae bacterium]
MGKLIEQGDRGKEFLLKDNRGKDVQLSDFKGKKVLLSFHPLAWTGVCAEQMKALEQNKDKFDHHGTVALGFSVDSVPSKNAWAKSLEIEHTPLLCDFWPHGEAAEAYGLFRAADGFSERANVILDETGQVIFVKVYPIAQLPDLDEIFEVLSRKS